MERGRGRERAGAVTTELRFYQWRSEKRREEKRREETLSHVASVCKPHRKTEREREMERERVERGRSLQSFGSIKWRNEKRREERRETTRGEGERVRV
jgi:hypothetical protein